MSIDPDQVAAEALRLVAEAEAEDLVLRVSGGAAIYLRVRDPALMRRLGRAAMSDVDLVAPAKHRGPLRRLLDRAGYDADPNMLASGEGRRFAFWHRDPPHLEVDLFIDRLEMSHSIDWRERMRLPGPTLPVSDLLLQKLQIARLTDKDSADVTALLVTAGEDEIDLEYLSALLGNDWGFHHTVELNLERVAAGAGDRDLGPDELDRLRDRIARTREALQAAPKSRRWQRRARVGERRPWFEHVEDEKTAF